MPMMWDAGTCRSRSVRYCSDIVLCSVCQVGRLPTTSECRRNGCSARGRGWLGSNLASSDDVSQRYMITGKLLHTLVPNPSLL